MDRTLHVAFRTLVPASVLALGLSCSSCAPAIQSSPPSTETTPITLLHLGYASRINVIFSDSALATLEGNWHRYDVNVTEPEHAYCLSRYTVTQRPNEMIDVHVVEIQPAHDQVADPVSVVYECGAMPSLHTHPPEECDPAGHGRFACRAGHPDLILCIPSDQDLETANRAWHRFAILQCGRSMFTVYTPDGYDELREYFPGNGPPARPDSSGPP